MAQFREGMPKHRRLFEALQDAIVSGRYAPGRRLPSEAALVRRYGVSRPTAAKALDELQAAGLIERRSGSGSYVLATELFRNRLLGLLIPGLGNTEIFEPICAEIARQAQLHHFSLLWGHSSAGKGEDAGRLAEKLCRQYIAERVAGVFFAPVELMVGMAAVNHRIASALDAAGIALVLLDRDLERFPQRSKYDLVGIDNRRAAYQLTEHLLELGCRHIDFVCRPLSAPTVDDRIEGWRTALAARGIHAGDDWLRRGDPENEDFVRDLARHCANGVKVQRRGRNGHAARRPGGEPAGERIDAFFCANDITAAQLMRSLLKLGVRIPQHVRLVSIDDVKYSHLFSVALTTVRQPCRELGAAAIAAMIERMAHPEMPARDILLDCQLVIRDSCGATRPKQSRTVTHGTR